MILQALNSCFLALCEELRFSDQQCYPEIYYCILKAIQEELVFHDLFNIPLFTQKLITIYLK